jgi:ABC-2 type transport system permease protein
VMRLTAAQFRKLFTTRLWLWMLLASAAWTAGYTALAIGFDNGRGAAPPLTSAAGQHVLFAIGAGGAVFAGWAIALAAAGTLRTLRKDIS